MASAAADDHASAFAEIKQLVATEFPHRAFDEAECRRVLAARKFDVAAAMAQYRKTLAWKDEFQIDTILERPPPEMREFIIHNCPISHHKWAKTGAPVFIEQMGKTNIPAMHKHGVTDNHVYLAHAWDMETVRRRCAEASARHGRHMEQNLNIIDVAGLNFSHVKGLHFMKAVVDIDLAHYPGTLERMCIINTPAVFPVIWNIAKGWLDPVTVSKIEIFGTDFKPRLLELIDADQLPVEYGGTCMCEGGCVPKPQFEEKVVVPARDKVERRVACAEAGGELAWFFATVGNDCKFCVEFQPAAAGAAKIVVQALGKCDSHHFPVSGVHTSNAPGEWIVTWDNSYSWLTSKNVEFTLRFAPPVSELDAGGNGADDAKADLP